MALGGGFFTAQNKTLPGSYINFISRSAAKANEFERGIAAFPSELSWGPELEVRKITADEFVRDSLILFGCTNDDESLKGLRDLFLNINMLYLYRLDSGGVKAKNSFGEAKYTGRSGNRIKINAYISPDDEGAYVVQTIFGTEIVDIQTVVSIEELKDNDFVEWKAGAELKAVASEPMTGGENGTVSGDAHQLFLDAIEKYDFHAVGTTTTDETVKKLYAAYEKRSREEIGKKFQVVLHQYPADYEGVVNVKNNTKDAGWSKSSLVYYTTGIIAGCALGASNTNRTYAGEFSVDTDYTQFMLERAVLNGEFAYHTVGDDVRVLMDLTSLTTVTDDKEAAFMRNETVRTIDNIAIYAASLFAEKYLGKIRNDPAGRVSFHTDLCLHLDDLVVRGAITGYEKEDVIISLGEGKADVVVSFAVVISGVMEKLYMTCVVG